MSKQAKGKGRPAPPKKRSLVWQLVFAAVVLAGLSYAYVLMTPRGASDSAPTSAASAESKDPALKNRMVLPARPRVPRSTTLDPAGFTQPEIRDAYQAAKDDPESLEGMACYCGCFATAGHRSNLDCFHDAHGTECGLCRAIALEARREHSMGVPIAEIKHKVDLQYAPLIR